VSANLPDLSKKFSDLAPEEFRFTASYIRYQNRRYMDSLYLDWREFNGAWYWERGFLSCAIAGAKMPEEITVDCFKLPWNRIIFEALHLIRSNTSIAAGTEAEYSLLTAYLSLNDCFDQSFKDYLTEIRNMIGIPSAVYAFAVKIIELNAGVSV
jgi:hypothetical protein